MAVQNAVIGMQQAPGGYPAYVLHFPRCIVLVFASADVVNQFKLIVINRQNVTPEPLPIDEFLAPCADISVDVRRFFYILPHTILTD